ERLLLVIVEVLVAEEGRQAHLQECGHGGSEEPDGVPFSAGGAVLSLRLLLGIGALVDEDREDVAGPVGLGQIIGDGGGAEDASGSDEVTVTDVEGREVLVQFVRVSTGEVEAIGFAAGADECPKPRVLRNGFAADVLVLIRRGELIADGGLDDAPPVAAAIATVD